MHLRLLFDLMKRAEQRNGKSPKVSTIRGRQHNYRLGQYLLYQDKKENLVRHMGSCSLGFGWARWLE